MRNKYYKISLFFIVIFGILLSILFLNSCSTEDNNASNYVGNYEATNWSGFINDENKINVSVFNDNTALIHLTSFIKTNNTPVFPNKISKDNIEYDVVEIRNINYLCGKEKILMPKNLQLLSTDIGIIANPDFCFNSIKTWSVDFKEIGDNIFDSIYSENIVLLGFNFVEVIGNNFFNNCPNLNYVNIDNLSKIHIIGNNFLANNPKLQSEQKKQLDFKYFTNVVTIADGFLSNCLELQYLDFTGYSQQHAGFGNVTSIGNNFLWGDVGLKTIVISSFVSLTTTGSNYLPSNPPSGCIIINNAINS